MRGTTKPVYVWEFPVRLYHWLNALCIAVLFITGIYIGAPSFFRTTEVHGDAAVLFTMGEMFYWHMVAGYVFAANFLFRVYWAFVGNEYARTNHWPWEKAYWLNFWDTVLHYLFIKKDEPHHLGHNPLANFSYFIFMILGSVFMILTGLAMYSELHPSGAIGTKFWWVLWTLGGSYFTHMFHHIFAWLIGVFVVIHVYMSIRHDIYSKTGSISSMFSGYKYDAHNSK